MTWYEMFLLLKFVFAVYLILFIHKWGHYCFARFTGIKVTSFNVGRGPILYHTVKSDCLWTFQLFPISGRVKAHSTQLQHAPLSIKLGYYLAGAINNLLFYLLCYGYFSFQQTGAFWGGIVQALKGIYHLLLLIPTIKLSTIYSPDRDLVGQLELYNSLAQLMHSTVLGLALLSLLYAMVNLLPIPGLDGGRIILLLIEEIGSFLRVKESLLQKWIKTCLVIGTLILFSPFIVNNIWSISLELGLTLIEIILWVSLTISIIMNIHIFLEKQTVLKRR
ncbi:site-2 protease family protein [Alkalihalobacterium elongatum]|uniref:site-2 protease family protein n=1 Tax=Alkalihalobacterium elongatum TaxID=2675466 RepID=UPI001C1F7A4B|nr:site-2 protease family protein [Alkalihalobacterium elongatum]